MANKESSDNGNEVGKFSEIPPPHLPHVRNYLNYLGSLLAHFRNGLPVGEKSSQRMAERLSLYTGTPVSRQRVVRAESGDERISMDIYAGILDEMKVWPDIIWALEKGEAKSARFSLLIERELSDDISRAHKDGLKRLRNQKNREAWQ